MTNTERLIANLEHAIQWGKPHVIFYVGKYTGNGPSVVAALRRRGYSVERTAGVRASYTLWPKP